MMNRQADLDLYAAPTSSAASARAGAWGWWGFVHHHAVS